MRSLGRFLTHLSTTCLGITILAGAFVHATGSGLACPDWPLCLGQFFPEMTGAVLYEHSHRLIAGTTGVIVWITGLYHLSSPIPRGIKLTSLGVMVFIVVQAVLGGLTVLYQLPGWISTLHFLLAHLTFGGMLFLSWFCYRSSVPDSSVQFYGFSRILAPVTLLVLFVQMGIGAWLRHIGSKGPPLASICESFPWCEPKWITVMTGEYLVTYWTHRFSSVLVVLLVASLAFTLLRERSQHSLDFTLAYTGALTVLIQVVLGVLTVRSSLSVAIAMLHTAGGLTLFSIYLWLNFRIANSIFSNKIPVD